MGRREGLSSAFDAQQRDVVTQVAAAPVTHRIGYEIQTLSKIPAPQVSDLRQQAHLAEVLLVRVERLDDPVGVEIQAVAWLEQQTLVLVLRALDQPMGCRVPEPAPAAQPRERARETDGRPRRNGICRSPYRARRSSSARSDSR